MKMEDRCGILVRWMHQTSERGENMYEWRMMLRSREGLEWDVSKWKTEIDRVIKCVGLNKWKNEMERKTTLEWYRMKEAPKYERWYDGTLGGDLLFRARVQCMDVNARTYRWSESHSKECQMCDMGVDETVEHVVLECEKYERERRDMMDVVLTEMGSEAGVVIERTGIEWMVLLLGLCEETTERMIDAVKEFLEKMWSVRRNE